MAHDLLVAEKEYVMIGRFPQQLWPGIQLNESFPNGQDCGLSAIIDLEFMKDIPHVVLDGFFAQVQVIGNFLVRLAVCNQA
jgi:hypothetical protein